MKKKNENVEVEAYEVNDKKSMILKVLVGVLAFIVVVASCFGAGYFGVQLGNKETEEEKTEEKEENQEDDSSEENDEEVDEDYNQDDGFSNLDLSNVDVDVAVIKKLFDTFREDINRPYWSGDGAEAKKYIAYSNLSSDAFSKVKCGNLEDSYIDFYYCAMNDESDKYYGTNEKAYEEAIKNETTTMFTYAVFEKKYKEIFGQNATFTTEDFSVGEGPVAHYDSKNKAFAIFSCQCGGENGPSTHKLTSVVQDGTKLVLHTLYINAWNEEMKIGYTFELEKETGNYIFVSRVEK